MLGIPHFFGFQNQIWRDRYSVLIVGPKRQGKSTILSMIAQRAFKKGITVYSNYPIDNTVKIPKIKTRDGRTITDKTFFYDNPLLDNSIVLLDEVSNIWNNRSWGKWSEEDSDFFNFLGKNNTRIFMAVQYYDMVDLNVKRNLDSTWYVEKSIIPGVSVVECDIQDVRKVEKLDTKVLDSKWKQVTFESCVIPDGRYMFRRKPWYPYFLTLYKDDRPERDWNLENWKEICFGSVGVETEEESQQKL